MINIFDNFVIGYLVETIDDSKLVKYVVHLTKIG